MSKAKHMRVIAKAFRELAATQESKAYGELAVAFEALATEMPAQPPAAKSRPTNGAGFSVAQFCARNNLSRSKYYRLRDLGRGPAEVRPGGPYSHPLITPEAETAWRQRWTRHHRAAPLLWPEHQGQ